MEIGDTEGVNKKHFVIFVPGLVDGVKNIEWATRHWRKYGLEPIVHSVGWRDGERDFVPKLQRLVGLIDELSSKNNKISLVGTSAGGSVVVNAFYERRNVVHRVINVCGRIRKGQQKGFRSLTKRAVSSPSFAQSVELCEKRLEELSGKDRKKIMTVRAMFGDELVPGDTTILKGARNIRVPTPEYLLSIGAALTIFSKPLILFLTKPLSA